MATEACSRCGGPVRVEPGLTICWNGHTFYAQGAALMQQIASERERGTIRYRFTGARARGKRQPQRPQ